VPSAGGEDLDILTDFTVYTELISFMVTVMRLPTRIYTAGACQFTAQISGYGTICRSLSAFRSLLNIVKVVSDYRYRKCAGLRNKERGGVYLMKSGIARR